VRWLNRLLIRSNDAALRQHLAVDLSRRRDHAIVDVINEKRLFVKERIIVAVNLGHGTFRQPEILAYPIIYRWPRR